MKKLPEIATLWIGDRLSWLEQLCLKSFADAGHSTTLYSYAPIPNVPEGVQTADAADILPAKPMLRHVRTGSPAIHADMWRLHLLKETDKIWVDADVYCYRPFDFRKKFVFGWEKDGLVCNAVLGLPKNSKALSGMLTFFKDEFAIAPWLRDWKQDELRAARDAGRPLHMTEQPWGFTGPASVTWFLNKTGEIKHAEPQEAFYPISFQNRNHMIRPRFDIEEQLTEHTRGVHFWARRMKPRLAEKENNMPRKGSFLAKLIEKHNIDPTAAPIEIKAPAAHAPAPAARKVFESPLALLLATLNTEHRTRIVDVGANPFSTPPYATLLQSRGCEVWGFEPQPDAFAALEKSKSDLESYFPYAIGDGSIEKLNSYRDGGLTSIFKPYDGAFSYLGRSRANMGLLIEVETETRRLDDLDDVESFDILKMHAQGAEAKILQGGAAKLSQAMTVITEARFYQLYEGEPMLGGIDTELRNQGFQLHKFISEKTKVIDNSQVDRLRRTDHRNQVIDGDAVYIRDPGACAGWTDEQFKHLAIAASAIFESHDLALFCLDHLAERGAVGTDMAARYVDALPAGLVKDGGTGQ